MSYVYLVNSKNVKIIFIPPQSPWQWKKFLLHLRIVHLFNMADICSFTEEETPKPSREPSPVQKEPTKESTISEPAEGEDKAKGNDQELTAQTEEETDTETRTETTETVQDWTHFYK